MCIVVYKSCVQITLHDYTFRVFIGSLIDWNKRSRHSFVAHVRTIDIEEVHVTKVMRVLWLCAVVGWLGTSKVVVTLSYEWGVEPFQPPAG